MLSLDYLRGYFILVIIVDHLWKYPSAWTLISGNAWLWVTAAEGFVMISGFLIGYVRGFKNLALPLWEVTKKLWSRAALLYVWSILVSMGYLWLEWQHIIPHMPYTPLREGDYLGALIHFATSGDPHMWIHFLYLYAIFLAIAPGFVWLFRKGNTALAIIATLLLYLGGLVFDVEWMRWQVIFFGTAAVGFHFETIKSWWSSLAHVRRTSYKIILFSLSAITLASSIIIAFWPSLVSGDTIRFSEAIFKIEGFSPIRVMIAALWFASLAFLFEYITPFLKKYTFGIIEYLGTHSLTAYIVHGYVICLVNLLLSHAVPSVWDIPYNTFLGLVTILLVYALMRIPFIQRVIPK